MSKGTPAPGGFRLVTPCALAACTLAACGEPARTLEPIPIEAPAWTMEATGEPRVAEGADGTIAIAMPGERSLLLVDSSGAPVDTIGREGEGPGEFRQLGNVFALPDGRFAVVDPVLRRVTTIRRGSGDIVLEPIPRGHDEFSLRISPGGVWASQQMIEGVEDSLAIVVSRPPHAELAIIARIHVPPRQLIPLGEIALNAAPEYAARDAWGFTVGGVWLARGADNRIDSIDEDGRLARFGAVPFARIGTVAADRDRWRGLPAPERFRVDARPLAPVKGPFQEVIATDDGLLWFWLNQPAGHARELYASRRAGSEELARLSLPGAHKVVAAGPRHLFVYGQTDDAVTLSAHRRP